MDVLYSPQLIVFRLRIFALVLFMAFSYGKVAGQCSPVGPDYSYGAWGTIYPSCSQQGPINGMGAGSYQYYYQPSMANTYMQFYVASNGANINCAQSSYYTSGDVGPYTNCLNTWGASLAPAGTNYVKISTTNAGAWTTNSAVLYYMYCTPGTPSFTANPTSICISSPNGITYSVGAVSYATSYVWSVSGAGATITGGQGSTSITVNYSGTGTATVSVYATNNGMCNSGTTTSNPVVYAVPSYGTLSTTGPVQFCDASGNFSTAISISGYTGSPVWDWGSSDGQIHSWVSGASSGTCCFPKKVSASDANADRVRVEVSNGACGTSISPWVLLQNKYNEAPTSLASSSASYCNNAIPSTITLTATFPAATDILGNVEFATSCGGSPIASVAGNGTTTVSTTITAPSSTTTYYVRYNPGANTSGYTACAATGCASTTVTVNTAMSISSVTLNSGTNPVCGQGTATIVANGISGTGATLTWYTGSGATGSNLGSSNPLTVGGDQTYYAYVTGSCPAVQASYTLNTTTTAPTITAPASISTYTSPNNSCAAAQTFAAPTGSDGCSGEWSGGFNLASSSGPLSSVAGNLKLWCKGDAGVVKDASGNVAEWRDLSGTGNKFVQSNFSYRPTRNASSASFNGNPAITFGTTSTYLTLANSLDGGANGNYTVFVVDRLNGGTNSRLCSSASTNWLLGNWGGYTKQFYNNSWEYGAGASPATSTAADALPHLYEMSSAGTSGGGTSVYDYGNLLASGTGGSPNGPGVMQLNGWSNGLNEMSTGEVAEVIYYNTVLTSAQRQIVEGYLAYKYNLPCPLASMQAYQTFASNTTYGFIASDQSANTAVTTSTASITTYPGPATVTATPSTNCAANSTTVLSAVTSMSPSGNCLYTGNTTNDYLLVSGTGSSSSSNLNIGSNWTIESWVKFPLTNNGAGGWNTLFRGTGYHHIIVERNAASSSLILGCYYGGFYPCSAAGTVNGAQGFDVSTLSTGWHHLAAVGTGGATSFYIDGVFVGKSAAQPTDPIVAVGNYQGGGQGVGNMDEIKIYNTALSQNAISNLMTRQSTSSNDPNWASLVAYYKVDGNGTNSATGASACSTCNAVLQSSASYSTPTAYYTYNWSGPGSPVFSPSASTTNESVTLTDAQVANSGTYSVYASANGCNSQSSTTTVTITNTAPSITAPAAINNYNSPNNSCGAAEVFAAPSVTNGCTAASGGFNLASTSGPLASVASNLKLWCKGDAGVVKDASGNVMEWRDISGSGNKFTQGTSTARPVLTAASTSFNGYPALTFTTSQYLALLSSLDGGATSTYTAFVVDRVTGTNYRLCSSNSTNWLFGNWGGAEEKCYCNGWISSSANTPTPDVLAHMYELSSNGTTGSGTNFYDYGVLQATGTAGSPNGPGVMQLNGYSGFSENSTGDVAEVIYYNTILTAAQRQIVEGYLAYKYNLPCPIASMQAYQTYASSTTIGFIAADQAGNTAVTTQTAGLTSYPGPTVNITNPTVCQGSSTTVFSTSGMAPAGTALTTGVNSSGYLQVGNSGNTASNVTVGTTWTEMAWVKFPLPANPSWNTLFRGVSYHHIIVERTQGTTNAGLLLGTHMGAFYPASSASVTNGSTIAGNAALGQSVDVSALSSGWHHIAATGTGGITNFYIDGVYVGHSTVEITNDNIVSVGNYQGGGQDMGTVDEVKVYNVALPQNAISNIMTQASTSSVDPYWDNMVAYYKMDASPVVNSATGTAACSSCNGTVQGTATAGSSTTGYYTYTWAGSGSPTFSPAASTTAESVTLTNAQVANSGTFTVKATANTCNSQTTTTGTVTVNATSNAGSFVNTEYYCQTTGSVYTAAGSNIAQSITGYTGSITGWQYGTNCASLSSSAGAGNATSPWACCFPASPNSVTVTVQNGVCPAVTACYTYLSNAMTAPTGGSVSPASNCASTGNITLTYVGGFTGNITGGRYQWYSGSCGGTPVGTGQSLVIPAPATTTNYYVQCIDVCGSGSGCYGPITFTVTPNAAVTSVMGTSPLCINGTATYTANGVVLGGGTGSWSSSNPGIASVNSSTGLVTGVAGGTCNIIYTITGGCGGTASAQQSLTVYPNASVASVTGTSPLCFGSTATYTANSVVLGGTGTGAWSSSNSAIASVNASTGVVTAVAGGTCNIIYTITGGCGGAASAQQAVTVYNNLSATIAGGVSPACYNTSPGTFTATGTGGTGTYTYQWYNGAGIISGSTASTYTAPALTASNSYYCSVTSGSCGTVSTPTTAITVEPPVSSYGTVSASGGLTQTVCDNVPPNSGNPLVVSGAAGSSGSFSYVWYYQNGLIAAPSGSNTTGWTPCGASQGTGYTTSSFTAAGTSGNITYACFVTPASPVCNPGQWATNDVQVTVLNSGPTETSSGGASVCIGGSVTLSSSLSVMIPATYQWYSSTNIGFTSPVTISGATTTTYAPPTGTSGTTYYEIVATFSGSGCTPATSNAQTVVVFTAPSASISGGSSPICYHTSPGTFTATGSGGSGSYSYQWYNSSGSVSGATASTYDPGLINTSDAYHCSVTDVAGCGVVSTSTTSITVDANLVANISGGTTPICYNASPGTFTATATGGTGSYTYQWYNGSGAISGANASTYAPGNLTSSNSYFCAVSSGSCGTVNTGITNITVRANLTANVIGGASPICYNAAPGTFTVISSGGSGTYTYQWYNGSGSVSGATASTYAPGNLTASDGYHCSVTSGTCGSVSSNTVSIVVDAPVSATVSGGVTPICYNTSPGTFTVTGAGGTGSYIYQWYNGAGSVSGSTASTYSPGNITASDAYHCSVTSGSCGSASSNTVSIVVESPVSGTASGGTSPICYNTAPGTFTATGAGGNGSYTYQWYTSAGAVNAATASTYAPGSITATESYYCQISSGGCVTANTNTIVITVSPLLSNINPTLSSNPVCITSSGGGTNVEIAGSLSGVSYQLQTSAGANIGNPVTGTGGTIDLPTGAVSATSNYQVYVYTSNGCTYTSPANVNVVAVNPDIAFGSQLVGQHFSFGTIGSPSLPANWTTLNNSNGDHWTLSASSPASSNSYSYYNSSNTTSSASTGAYIQTPSGASSTVPVVELISGPVDVTGFSNISVQWGAQKSAGYTGTVSLYYSIDGGSNWVAVPFTDVQSNLTGTPWTLVNNSVQIKLPSVVNDMAELQFKWTANPSTDGAYYSMNDIGVYGLGKIINCASTSIQLPYLNTSCSVSQYSLTADGTNPWPVSPAFNYVTDAAVSGSPISIAVPSNTVTGTYNLDITVNDGAGHSSSAISFPVTTDMLVTATAGMDNCSCNYTTSGGIGNAFGNIVTIYAGGGAGGSYYFASAGVVDTLLSTIDGSGNSYAGTAGHSGVKGVFWSKADGASHTYTVSDEYCSVIGTEVTQSTVPSGIPFGNATGQPAAITTGQGGGNGISGSFNNTGTGDPNISNVNGKALTCHQTATFGNNWVIYQVNNLDASGQPVSGDSTNNKAVVEINNQGTDLDSVEVSVYRDANLPEVPNAATTTTACYGYPEYAMERHFMIKSTRSTQANSFVSPVGVRLYFTDAEFQDLAYWTMHVAQTATGQSAGCAYGDTVTNLNSIYVTKYTGINEDGSYLNNASSGLYRLFGKGATNPGNGPLTAIDAGQASLVTGGSTNLHYVQMNVTEFSEFWLGGSQSIEALPVQMIYLEAEAMNNDSIQVRWATATEINNREFDVERSEDGNNWTMIATVPGHGNTTSEEDYAYNDLSVVPGINYYYRLKQVDNNGNYEYTGIVQAEILGQGAFTVMNFVPNPTLGKTQLTVVTTKAQEITVDFYDMLGQKVFSSVQQLVPGNNRIDFDLARFAGGTYSAVVTSENQLYTKKIVVAK